MKSADSDLGPVISREQFDRVAGYIDIGQREGARIVTGGGADVSEGRGYYLKPTVLADALGTMRVVREEIFGPVLCVQRFDEDDLPAIAAKANDTEYGLAASVWTRDLATAHQIVRQIKASTVWVNTHSATDPALPFGGYKQSGWGREMGRQAVESYSEVKSVAIQLF